VLITVVLAVVTLLPGPARAVPPPGSGPMAAPAVTAAAAAASAGAATTSAGAAGGRWVAPLPGPVVVVRPFAPPPVPWLPGHRGVDLAAERGDVVRAARAGTVTVAGDIAGRGVVVVSHLGGLRTTYEPVVAVVAVGDAVDAGDVIGTLAGGDVHCGGAAPCLHWGLRRGRDYLDPMLLIEPMRPVLLPP
jgi:murein DD-endopeptidase MepM/ murein hydrolase activator NlpD